MTAETYSPAWLAPVATKELRAEISLPGSKSLNNRELVLSALAASPTTLSGVLKSRDSDLMIAALRSLGTEIVENSDGSLTVNPVTKFTSAAIDCGLAGTVMRFVPPIAALAAGDVEKLAVEPEIEEPAARGGLEKLCRKPNERSRTHQTKILADRRSYPYISLNIRSPFRHVAITLRA
jgi:hypothetical protein